VRKGAFALICLIAAVSGCAANAAPKPAAKTAPAPKACGKAGAKPTRYDHVIWIVMENKAYSDVLGGSSAPFLRSLASACGQATNFHAETHPSLPNYIAMTSGSTQGITDDSDPSAYPLTAASIFSQLGSGWQALEESMPSNCNLTDSGQYAVRHNPAVYYTTIGAACQAQDLPLASAPDVSARLTFITPNLCDDMHSSCSDTISEVQTGDDWLSGFLPKVLSSSQYQAGHTAIFITWDEDDGSDSNHVPTFVIAPSVPAGTTVSTTFNHYSMLRTTEEMLGIGSYLGGAGSAISMRSGFHL
jgi:hypothetical protein